MDAESLPKFLIEHRAEIRPTCDVTGLIQFGIDMDDDERRQISKIDERLVSNFALIAEGEEPRLGFSLGMLIGGVLLGLMLLGSLSGDDEEGEAAEDQA